MPFTFEFIVYIEFPEKSKYFLEFSQLSSKLDFSVYLINWHLLHLNFMARKIKSGIIDIALDSVSGIQQVFWEYTAWKSFAWRLHEDCFKTTWSPLEDCLKTGSG